jgi:hypothetical protein
MPALAATGKDSAFGFSFNALDILGSCWVFRPH